MPAAADLKCHLLLLADGRRLSWREAGSGPPLVLLHGWSMSSIVFTEVMVDLANGFRVLAPDLRGHGGSDPGEGYALGDLANDLEEWFTALGLTEAAVLGWSLGGQVAQQLAVRIPRLISSLLLVATTPCFAGTGDWEHGLPETQIKAMARDLRRGYTAAMSSFFNLQFVEGEIDSERHRQIIAFAVRPGRLPDPDVALATLETLRREDLRPAASRLQLPVLIMHGDSDRIIPVSAGRYLATELPQTRYVEWSGIGHAPFLSRPRESVQLWREFLS